MLKIKDYHLFPREPPTREYIIEEKEDNNYKFLFEGKYLNGQRWNGKVIKYSIINDKPILKGKYLNGKIIWK